MRTNIPGSTTARKHLAIGNMMLTAGSNFEVPLVFAATPGVAVMGIGMCAIFALFERRFTAWSVRGPVTVEYASGGYVLGRSRPISRCEDA